MADSRVNMPNVFTPNGDQINDTYKPVFDKMTTFETYLFTIYDRWGQKVFETSDPNITIDLHGLEHDELNECRIALIVSRIQSRNAGAFKKTSKLKWN